MNCDELFSGIFYAFAIFGPAFGFLMSSSFLRYHTDFLQSELNIKYALVPFLHECSEICKGKTFRLHKPS